MLFLKFLPGGVSYFQHFLGFPFGSSRVQGGPLGPGGHHKRAPTMIITASYLVENQRMPSGIQQVMSPRLAAFACPPRFAPAQAIPQLEASFAFITDRIHYQSGEEEVSAERVNIEANLRIRF